MKRKNYTDPIPGPPSVTLLAPSFDDMYVDWFEALTSPWNQKVLAVVVSYVLSAYSSKIPEDLRNKVEFLSAEHLRQLQVDYRSGLTPGEYANMARLQRSITYKREVRYFS